MRGSGAAQSNGLNLPIQNGCFAAASVPLNGSRPVLMNNIENSSGAIGLQLEGVYSVLPTPFHPNGDIDLGSLRRVVDLFIQAGVDGVRSISEVGRKR